MESKISTGAMFLDEFLGGGYEKGIVTTLYGPSGSGKTNFCLLAGVSMAKRGKKVLFIDTEGGVCVERISQLSQGTDLFSQFIFFNPLTFKEQTELIEQLDEAINEHIGLIIVDSIAMLYRLAASGDEQITEINAIMARQVTQLVSYARKYDVPILLTNQVYADFTQKDQVKMVGGDLLKYGSKCLLELQRNSSLRNLVIRKHRFLAEGKKNTFNIVDEGLVPQ